MKSFFHLSLHVGMLAIFAILTNPGKINAQQASLTVQGVLTKSDGTAVEDGVYQLTFRLWNDKDASAGANKKHEETINDVETVGGVYTVILGVNGTPLTAGFDEVYWLGVSMNTSNVELLPRPRLTHAPYALGIKGQNNTFPSTGAVIGDAFRAKGGPAQGGPGGNGFAFQSATGDPNGGMFSNGADNVSFYAGGIHKIKITPGLNELFGQTNTNDLTVFGALSSGDLTVNGSSVVTVNSQVNGQETVKGNEVVEGYQYCNKEFLTKKAGDGGGFSFDYDTDSGLFGSADGVWALKANGIEFINANANTGTAFFGPHAGGGPFELAIGNNDIYLNTTSIRINNLSNPGSGASGTLKWHANTGKIWVDNSSRRYKSNIRTLEDDFSKILKATPRLYNRPSANPEYEEIGYIAEEMDSIGLKRLVEYNLDGTPEAFNYDRMILYAVELLKIQDAAIADLKNQIAALKSNVAELSAANTALSAENTASKAQQATIDQQLEALSRRIQSIESLGTNRK